MSTAAIIGGSIAAAGIGALGSSSAAGTQADAATAAAQLQAQSAREALDFQKQQFATQQENIAPWLKAGQGAVTSLSDMVTGGGFPDWKEQFQAPTNVTEANDPGYQFRLQQGTQALQNSAAARGGLLSGGTAKDLEAWTQGYASNEYSNVYNRAIGEYLNRYNIFQQNQSNRFNRYASLAGMGQTATGQLGQAGQAASGNVSNILLGSSGQIGQSLQNAAAARASGYAGVANAFGGAIGNIGQLLTLRSLLGGGATGGIPTGPLPNPDIYSGIGAG